MKKIIVCFLATMILATSVYADTEWFSLVPNIDSNAQLINKYKYKGVKKVVIKSKIIEIGKELLSKY